MPEEMTELQFDFESYLAKLLENMNMQEASEETQKDLTLQLGRQLAYRLMVALSLSLGDKDLSNMAGSEDGTEFKDLIEKAIEQNPELKEVALRTLNEFYAETMETFGEFQSV